MWKKNNPKFHIFVLVTKTWKINCYGEQLWVTNFFFKLNFSLIGGVGINERYNQNPSLSVSVPISALF